VILPDWLDVAARENPNRAAMSFGDREWSYRQLRQSTLLAAQYLQLLTGATEGRIGILAANCPGYVMLVHAARRLGAEIVPLNWRLSADEIAWQVAAANVGTVFVDAARLPLAKATLNGLTTKLVHLGQFEAVAQQPGLNALDCAIELSRPAAVLFTSGTSGRPKGAVLTNGNLWFSAVGSAFRLGQRPDDVWLASLPFFHIGGLSIILRACIGALPIVLQETFDPALALSAIDDGVTHLSVVPVMLRRMLEIRGSNPWPPHLRCVLLGGAGAPRQLIDDSIRLGLPVAPTYGLTETASQATTLLPGEAALRPDSAGLPLPTTQIRIIGSEGEVGAGEIGEIDVRGPTVFAGYLGDPSSALRSDRWFSTGDLGYLDDEGFLYVTDRRNDLIVSGGENIYPAEIERALLEHPSVGDAGVVGIANDEWGARPIAAVVWVGPSASVESLLGEFLRARLAAYKIPDRIVELSSLPRSSSGKLLRRELQQLLTKDEPDS
jgi:O-succinylbenzoic acid--CoA ligase